MCKTIQLTGISMFVIIIIIIMYTNRAIIISLLFIYLLYIISCLRRQHA
jgi:hypothetical protein